MPTYYAVLCWAEYYNGKWQPSKTSDVTKPTSIARFSPSGADAFDADRNLIRLVPTQYTGQAYTSWGATAGTIDLEGALLLAIVLPSDWSSLMVPGLAYTAGFALYNTHSLPVRFEDVLVPWTDGTS